MADRLRLFAGGGIGTSSGGHQLPLSAGGRSPASFHGILQGSTGSGICSAFADLVGFFHAGGGYLFSGSISEYLPEYAGRTKERGQRAVRDGGGIPPSPWYSVLLHLPSGVKAFFAQRVSAISGNVLEVRSGGGSDWHSQSFIGGALYLAKIYLDTADLFAWTAVIVVLSVFFEKIIFYGIEVFFRWEPACKDPSMPQKIAGREQRTLCVRNLGKSFHNQWIFRHVDHEFHSGEPYVLDNPSGSGKTTFFRCLCGLERPEEGEVSEMDAFAMQFQEDRLCEDCSAVKNLEMILGDVSQARTALTQLLPEEALDQPCHELSGGMKRRVSLVRAMEAEAQCVLLDEPFTGLDEENRKKAEDYIRRKTRGRIVMIATHIRTGEEFSEMTQMQI